MADREFVNPSEDALCITNPLLKRMSASAPAASSIKKDLKPRKVVRVTSRNVEIQDVVVIRGVPVDVTVSKKKRMNPKNSPQESISRCSETLGRLPSVSHLGGASDSTSSCATGGWTNGKPMMSRKASCPGKVGLSRRKKLLTRSLSDPLVVIANMDALTLKNWVSVPESSSKPVELIHLGTKSMASMSRQCARDLLLEMAEDVRKVFVEKAQAKQVIHINSKKNSSVVNSVHSSNPSGSEMLGMNLVVHKDCVFEFDRNQEKQVMKYATCDQMVRSLVDRFVENESTHGNFAELFQSSRYFCAGSLKLWSVKQVLDSMRMVKDQMLASMKVEAESRIRGLERLIHIWIQMCFPRCVSTPERLQAFFALVRDLSDTAQNETEMVQLVQANSTMNKRGVMQRDISARKALPKFIGKPVPTDFLQLDVLTISAVDLATELTRVSLDLMRELPLDQLVQMSTKLDADVVRTAHTLYDLPPLFVLRKRTERLSNWTASAIVSEKKLRRRIELYAKMVATAAKLVDIRNMHDAVAMVSALHNPAVSRLRSTIRGAGDTVSSALVRLTDLIRPPYQKLRKMSAEAEERNEACLPSLEVLVQDMIKLDEIERNFVKHPQSEMLLGNVWKINLIGSWVTKFRDAFVEKVYEFETKAVDKHHAVVFSFVKVLPDVFDRDTLWIMSKKLEPDAEGPW